MENITLNRLPAPTFSWLGVNEAHREIKEYETSKYEINAAKGEKITKIIFLQNSGEKVFELSVNAQEHSTVELIQVFASNKLCAAKINAQVADAAQLRLVQLYLNTADTLCDVNVLLQGYNSNLSADIAYLLGESKKLDLNLLASHKGKKSSSEINVRGVLKKGSEKVFKGTIDFLSGSEGAVGAEQEDVLLMDEGVVNKTVPLILCAEEDVSGSHGASIGRVDEKQVFYMRSRGLSEEKIYDLMAQAKLRQVIDMIDDEDAKRRISTILTGGAEVVT